MFERRAFMRCHDIPPAQQGKEGSRRQQQDDQPLGGGEIRNASVIGRGIILEQPPLEAEADILGFLIEG